VTTVTISLPDSLKAFVDSQIDAKGYGNVSEYFRSLLREAQAREQDARLKTLLLEGLASGPAVSLDEAFWRDLKAEAAQLVKARRTEQAPE
jgi:antitoxin ParD1/3/4